jgi:hypothetical protein
MANKSPVRNTKGHHFAALAFHDFAPGKMLRPDTTSVLSLALPDRNGYQYNTGNSSNASNHHGEANE